MEDDRLLEIANNLRVIAGMMMEDLCPLAIAASSMEVDTLQLREGVRAASTLMDAAAILLERATSE